MILATFLASLFAYVSLGCIMSCRFSGALAGVPQAMHSEAIESLALSPDGSTLATSGMDTNILLWNTRTGHSEHILVGHTSLVITLAFSPDGAYLASGGFDKTARLWDARTGRLLRTFRFSQPVDVVAFSPDGTLLACGTGEFSNPAGVSLFDVHSGTLLRVVAEMKQEVKALAFSPDSHLLAVNGFPPQVNLWSVQTGALKRSIKVFSEDILSLAFSPDGQWVAAGTGGIDNMVGSLYLWSVRTGRLKWIQSGVAGPVWCVAFSPDGQTLLHGGGKTDETMQPAGSHFARTDMKTGAFIKEPDAFRGLEGGVAFSRDGSTVAAFFIPDPEKSRAGDMVGIWEARTGILKKAFQAVKVGGLGWLVYAPIRQERLNRALIAAIKKNDTKEALVFLAEGADPNSRDEPSQHLSLWRFFLDRLRGKRPAPSTAPTALMLACPWGDDPAPDNWQLVKALVGRGAHVNVTDNETKLTPLLLAVSRNKTQVSQLLIERGANINVADTFWKTTLMYAAENDNKILIRLLVNKGAEVNAVYLRPVVSNQESMYGTPLIVAQLGKEDDPIITELLLSRGAKVNGPGGIKDGWMGTPLTVAILTGKVRSVRVLLRYGADVNLKGTWGLSNGGTPLKMAKERGDKQIIQMLKQAGAKD